MLVRDIGSSRHLLGTSGNDRSPRILADRVGLHACNLVIANHTYLTSRATSTLSAEAREAQGEGQGRQGKARALAQ